MKNIKLILSLIIIDFIYLYFIGSKPFINMIENIQKSSIEINIFSGIIAYIFLIFLLKKFIIENKKTPEEAFILGLCVYGVYDSTNLALLKDYKYNIALQDTIWGGLLFYITTKIYYI